jgi:hypothetical protein
MGYRAFSGRTQPHLDFQTGRLVRGTAKAIGRFERAVQRDAAVAKHWARKRSSRSAARLSTRGVELDALTKLSLDERYTLVQDATPRRPSCTE